MEIIVRVKTSKHFCEFRTKKCKIVLLRLTQKMTANGIVPEVILKTFFIESHGQLFKLKFICQIKSDSDSCVWIFPALMIVA